MKNAKTILIIQIYLIRKIFTNALQNIYNENKCKFLLKPNTIKNIIGKWKSNSLRFTKFNALINQYNKEGELILWEHTNSIIYLRNKKFLFPKNIIYGVAFLYYQVQDYLIIILLM